MKKIELPLMSELPALAEALKESGGKWFWAYAVTDGLAVLVKCDTVFDVEDERGRMRMSDAKTVGSMTIYRADETTMRLMCAIRGWTVEVVREFSPCN